MVKWLIDGLIEFAKRTPYTHIHHGGELYMERYWLVPYAFERQLSLWSNPLGWFLQQFGIAVRLHHIAQPDKDRAMHDHPWSFLSVVLRGGYVELRPHTIAPCFDRFGRETYDTELNWAGDVVFRRACDRHRIDLVEPDTWTLFVTGPQRQWWGFYTPMGKIYYRDYESEAYGSKTALNPAPTKLEVGLQRFKDYVHQRLDEAGIATHPNGPHSAAGCRVGDRLDIALGLVEEDEPVSCPTCQGKGGFAEGDPADGVGVECPDCGGTGVSHCRLALGIAAQPIAPLPYTPT